MKNLILIVGLLTMGLSAQAGIDKGNGGDICENEIRNITNDIEEWLLKDEFKGIKLPKTLTEDQYKDGMLEAIRQSILSCSTEKIFVATAEKTCRNFIDTKGRTQVICNFDRFMKTPNEDKYKLIHHEFAGVAGLEINNGIEKSNYIISNQISEYLTEQKILKLSIKNTNTLLSKSLLIDSAEITNALSKRTMFRHIESKDKASLAILSEYMYVLASNASYYSSKGETTDKAIIACAPLASGYKLLTAKKATLEIKKEISENKKQLIEREIKEIDARLKSQEENYLDCASDFI